MAPAWSCGDNATAIHPLKLEGLLIFRDSDDRRASSPPPTAQRSNSTQSRRVASANPFSLEWDDDASSAAPQRAQSRPRAGNSVARDVFGVGDAFGPNANAGRRGASGTPRSSTVAAFTDSPFDVDETVGALTLIDDSSSDDDDDGA